MRLAAALLLVTGCDRAFGLTLVTDAPAPVADAMTAMGVVAHYTMDVVGVTQGACLPDDSGNGHSGACLGKTISTIPGRVGMAFELQGMTRIQIAPGPTVGGPGPFTFAGWLYFDSVPVGGLCPFNRLYGSLGADSWQVCTDGNATTFYYTGAANVATAGLSSGVWHHLAIASSGSEVVSYIDGAQVGDSPGMLQFDTGPIVIGADVDGATETGDVTGALDDVWIFDHALTGPEILHLETL